MSKEISVIQHTSSFEKSDSLEQPGSLEGEDKSAAPFLSLKHLETLDHFKHIHSADGIDLYYHVVLYQVRESHKSLFGP